jgi:hypothetical protein
MTDELIAYRFSICCGPVDRYLYFNQDEHTILENAGFDVEPVRHNEFHKPIWSPEQARALNTKRKQDETDRDRVIDLLCPYDDHFASIGCLHIMKGDVTERQFLAVASGEAETLLGELLNFGGQDIMTADGFQVWGHIEEKLSIAAALDFVKQDARRSDTRYPTDDESSNDWATRVVVPTERLQQLAKRWEASGRDAECFKVLAPRSERAGEKFEHLIKTDSGGLLPLGAVSLVAGDPGSGKSTLLLQLAVDVIRGSSIDGLLVRPSNDALAVFLSLEDSRGVIEARLERMDPNDDTGGQIALLFDDKAIDDSITIIGKLSNVRLVVVDTAGAALGEHSTTDAGATRGLLRKFARLAHENNCAVVVVHHTTGKPGKKSGLPDTIAGSKEWVRAARSILIFEEVGGLRRLTARKSNSPSAEQDMQEALWLKYDPDTELHTRTSPPNGKSAGSSTSIRCVSEREEAEGAENEAIEAAIRGVISRGRYVTRTGARELYEHRCPELEGWKRTRVRAAVDDGLASGRLILAGRQVQVVDHAARAQPADAAIK